MKEAITKPLKGQEKAKAKGKTDARKAVSRREGVPPRAKVLSDGTTVVGIDIGERHVNLCEIDSDDAVTETRLGNTPKKLREQFEGKAKRRIVLEAGAHTRWIAELLGELGHEVLVVDPRRTKLISGSRSGEGLELRPSACESRCMTTTTIEQLEKKIDDLIRTHIADVRRKASAAVEKAFAAAAAKSPPAKSTVRRSPSRRRGEDEIRELGDLLYKAVCSNPGATMTTLSRSVGKKPQELRRPAKWLKRAGRIRSVGERNATRYFPLASKSA